MAALLRPSKAGQWSTCVASVAAQAGMVSEAGEAAARGTDLHALIAMATEMGITAEHAADNLPLREWTDADRDLAQRHLILTREFVDSWFPAGMVLVERPVSVECVTGESGAIGTPDLAVIGGGRLAVVDHKTGAGEVVEAEGNRQLLVYAEALCQAYDILEPVDEILLAIIQPAVTSRPKVWTLTRQELAERAAAIRQQALRALSVVASGLPPDAADYQPTESACRWCLAKATCPALQAKVVAAFESMPAVPPTGLVSQYESVPLLELWIVGIRRAMSDAVRAGQVPEYKVVEGRQGNRAWIDEAAALAQLKKSVAKPDYIRETLRTPTQVLDALKDRPRLAKKVAELVHRAPGKPQIARADDPRPALSAFEDLDA